MTLEAIETLARTAEILEALEVGSYRVVVRTNPFRGVLPEEPRHYVVVLTADGTTDDSHGCNGREAASRKAVALARRLRREGYAKA
jgi:hypothetical protein